jgi:acetyltransferase-like isoleucine patch superfamily enzyme
MSEDSDTTSRMTRAVHGLQEEKPDPDFEIGLAEYLHLVYGRESLLDLYNRFALGDGEFNQLMRRTIWRTVARKFGSGIRIGSGVGFKHLETFEIGNAVFIGAQAYIQGRFDGSCVIGNHVWIGPQSYFDARCLIIEDYVGWGPGAKVLGSNHSGLPIDVPIIQTDLEGKDVTIGAWADIGINAVILPGVTVGKGSVVGAGSIVTKDVAPFSIVAGAPAIFLKWRQGYVGEVDHGNKK